MDLSTLRILRTRSRCSIVPATILIVIATGGAAARAQTIRSTYYNGGPSAYVHYPHEARFDSTVAMTVEAWINPLMLELNPTIVSRNFATSYWFGLQVVNPGIAKLRFYRSGGLGVTSTGEIGRGQWSHVAAVYTGSQVQFYIDGVAAGTFALTNAGAGINTPLYIGGHPGGLGGDLTALSFNGMINEVRIWSVARTQGQIQAGMFEQLRGIAGLVAAFGTGGRHEDVGNVTGTSGGGTIERIEGIIPHDMVVPSAAFPTLLSVDGTVDLFDEYLGAEQLVLRYRRDSGATLFYANVHLVHTDTDLHIGVCQVSVPVGGWDPDNSWIGMLMDPDYSQHALAQPTDFHIQNNLGSVAPQFLVGTGAGGYAAPGAPPDPADWEVAKATVGKFGEQCMEFRVSTNLIGGFEGTDGLALAHFWLSGVGQDHLAPGDAVWNSPATWAQVQYDEAGPVLPRAQFTGRIPEGRCEGGDRHDNTCRFDADCPGGDCVLEGRTVWLMSSLRDTPLYTTTTTESGAFSFSDGGPFPGVVVPSGVDFTVQTDGCTGCRYPDAIVDEAAMAFTGIRPLSVHGLSVRFPSVCHACPGICGTTGTCTYPPITFTIQLPPGPTVIESIEPDFLRAPVVLRESPRKTIAGTVLRIRGVNLHDFIDVYLDGFCIDFPAYCERVPLEIVNRGRDEIGEWMDVELRETPPSPTFGNWGVTLHDRWTWGRTTLGIRGWYRAGPVAADSNHPFPLLWGFEFFNEADNSDWGDFTGVYGRNAYFCLGLPLPDDGCAGCRVPRPDYLLLFAAFTIIMDNIEGSCVGMASTSLLFFRGHIAEESFQTGVHYPAGFSGRLVDGDLLPPKPARYSHDFCGPSSMQNVWAETRRNHSVQLSAEFLQATFDDMRGGSFSIDGVPTAIAAEIETSPHGHVISMAPEIGTGHAVTPYGTEDAGLLCNGGCNDLNPCTSDADCPPCDETCPLTCINECPADTTGECVGGTCAGGCNDTQACTVPADCPDCIEGCPRFCVDRCSPVRFGTCKPFTKIKIYDNNWPGNANRVIWVNRTNNEYRFPRGSGEWRGTGIYTIPIRVWERARSGPGLFDLLEFVAILVFGGADGHYTTTTGGEWGWRADGSFVDALPGAVASPPLEGFPVTDSRNVPLLLPASSALPAVQINGRGGDFIFHVAHGGVTAHLQGLDSNNGDTAHVNLTGDADRLSAFRYEPDQRGLRVIPKLGISLGEQQNVVFQWVGLDVPAGAGLNVMTPEDPAEWGAGLDNDGGEPLHYHLLMEYVDGAESAHGRAMFGPIETPPGASQHIRVEDWPTFSLLRVETDADRDGIPEESFVLNARLCDDMSDPPPADHNGNGIPDSCESGGDFDGNFAVDYGDLKRLAECMKGPGVLVGDPSCIPVDLDFDGDVDLHDASLFNSLFSPEPRQSHDCCIEGPAGCNDPAIEECVCALDSYCCSVEWDTPCTYVVETGSCGDCDTYEHDCCDAGGPGCNDPAVMECICAQDPYCCGVNWDGLCVEEVDLFGCGFCNGLPDCCIPGGVGCDNSSIEDCVCAADSYCCNIEWDERCVSFIDLAACGSCTDHPCCITGGPGCDDPAIEDCVCLEDPHCCTEGWDQLCVQEVTDLACGSCGDHECCKMGTPGCDDAFTQACVCAQDPYCCTEGWDQQCIDNVERLACGSCGNDVCQYARNLSIPSFVIDETDDAILSSAPDCDGVSVTAPGRWYRVIGTGATITASTCSEFVDFDTRISVYSGACDDLTCVAANDDDCDLFTGPSTVRWCSEPGVPYWILVHGAGEETGGFYLSVYHDAAHCAAVDIFIHRAAENNTTDNWTNFVRPSTDGLPNSLVHVTQNYNPGGIGQTFNPQPLGVFYDAIGDNGWAIFNESQVNIPIGAAFNVVVPPPAEDSFVHLAGPANIFGNTSAIDHPDSNNNPDAIVFATQNWNPGGVGEVYNNANIGVWYDSTQWGIFNQGGETVPNGAAFNIWIAQPSASVFVHTATPSNTLGVATVIDHPVANNNPNAVLLVTQNWNPPGSIGVYNDVPVTVAWDDQNSVWVIFNPNQAAMPLGASFNVMVFPAPLP